MIQTIKIFQYQWKYPFTSWFTVEYTNMIESGFSSNICRFILTVGCCENTMASNIVPANPSKVRRVTSINQKVFLFRYSKISNNKTKISTALHNIVGVILSHILWLFGTFSAFAFNIMVVEDTRGSVFPALLTTVALSKYLRKVSGKNCCCM